MRTALLLALAACSNAAEPKTDAAFVPIDAAVDGTGSPVPDAAAMVQVLVVNEVASGESPDWFEVVNVTNADVQLDQFSYVDVADDFVKAKPFPTMILAPGAYYVQDVDNATSGFGLGGDEELWVYRISDQTLSDGVDWDAGAAPATMSYARSPNITGDFVTGAQSKGVANP